MLPKDNRELQKTIRAAQKGDERAFETLVALVEGSVYRLALSMTRHREDAEDASQETLIKLWRTLPGYRFECPILPYTLQIARNTTLDMLRHRGALGATVSLTVTDEDGKPDMLDPVDPDENSNPACAYVRDEQIAAVRAAIDALPRDYREILTLKDIEGLSYEQLGQVLSLEEGTVKSRLARARKKLKEILKTRNIF